MVRAIPEGMGGIIPYLIVSDGEKAIAFYSKVFGAQEIMRLPTSEGKIGHAEIKIRDSILMLADEMPEMNFKAPTSYGGTPLGLMLYVENVDVVVEKARSAGATVEREVEDQFWGDRTGTVVDPFGHRWTIATHIEDVEPAELERRMREYSGQS